MPLEFEGTYYYHGHLRWNCGWANPNFSGAFLATLEPAIWMTAGLLSCKSRGKTVGYYQFAAEFACWFLLAHTYSRGAMVAAFCARAAWQAMHRELTALKTWGRYLLAPLACTLLTGFGGRIYSVVATKDLSVWHRFDFWTAAARMLAAAPWTGWGLGRSGFAYHNWYENLSRNDDVTDMVSSYLTFGVERGLPALCLVIFISACFVYGGMSAARSAANAGRPKLVLAAATSAGIAWLVANFFSTIYAAPSLWIGPGVAAGVVATSRCTWQTLGVRKILRCAGFAVGLGCLFVVAGTALEGRSSILVRRSAGDVVTLESRIHSSEKTQRPAVDIWSDPPVLGNYVGRRLRIWMQQPGGPERLVVHAAFRNDPQPAQENRILVLVGRRASLLPSLPRLPVEGVILVNPAQWSREGLSRLRGLKALIVIPEIDQTGSNGAVKNEAHALGVKVLLSPGVGRDLRATWPDIIQPAINRL
jgi:hypothetical protein